MPSKHKWFEIDRGEIVIAEIPIADQVDLFFNSIIPKGVMNHITFSPFEFDQSFSIVPYGYLWAFERDGTYIYATITTTTSYYLVKLLYDPIGNTMETLATLEIPGVRDLGYLASDATNGFIYVATRSWGISYIYKVKTSDLTLDSTLTLGNSLSYIASFCVDPTNDFGYVAHTYFLPIANYIVKFRLSTMAVVTTLNTSVVSDYFVENQQAVIQDDNYVYFLAKYSLMRVDKATFSVINQITTFGTNPGVCMVNDATYIYLIGSLHLESEQKLIRVKVSTFTMYDAMSFLAGEEYIFTEQINSGYLYLGGYSDPVFAIKIDLSTFTRVDKILLPCQYTSISVIA